MFWRQKIVQASAIMRTYEEEGVGNQASAAAADRYRTLLEINNAIITNLDQQNLFHEICEALRRVITCDKAGLALYDPSVDDLRVAAMDGSYSTEKMVLGQFVDRKGVESGHEWDFRKVVVRDDLEVERQYSFEHILYAE